MANVSSTQWSIWPLRTTVMLWLWLNTSQCSAKTIQGVFASENAKPTFGQYITSFCFHGESAELQYTLNTTGHNSPTLYLFLDEDWAEARQEEQCSKKLELARMKHEITNTSGSQVIAVFKNPRIWHLVFTDSYTCDQVPAVDQSEAELGAVPGVNPEVPLTPTNYIEFHIQLLNPDSLGNPTDHFGDEESGLFRFYQLLVLGYFVAACIYSPRLHQSLQKDGPMHLVIQLLTVAMALQAIGALTMVFHLRKYSKDGIGNPWFELLSELFDMLSQFVMLYMLLSLSLGWSLGGSYKGTHSFSTLREKPAAKVIAAIAVLQGVLFVWEQFEEREHRMFHAHRSYAGVALVLVRIVLAALFAANLQTTVSHERSALKRQFYSSFNKSCMLWFLCYPVMMAVTSIFSAYLRYKLITMSVVLCQCAAVLMLYKLFLSRSLYWEVSSLSSYLPLRMDKTFGSKLYS